MGDDVAQGLVVGADGDPPSRDKRCHRLVTGRAEYRSWCVLCVAEERDRTSMIMVVRFSMDHWTVICCVSCKDAQQRCWIADKQRVSDVIMSDAMSIMENTSVMEWRGREVVPVESRVDEPLHQAERRACDERCAEWARDTTFEPSSVTFGFVCGVFWTSGEQIPERCSR